MANLLTQRHRVTVPRYEQSFKFLADPSRGWGTECTKDGEILGDNYATKEERERALNLARELLAMSGPISAEKEGRLQRVADAVATSYPPTPEELARLDNDVLAVRPQLVIWQAGANGALRDTSPAAFRTMPPQPHWRFALWL